MGKKDKKKGKGIEKTNLKTEKKLSAKQKKLLSKLGEDDIETIVSQIEEEEKKKLEVKEISLEKPTRRANFSFAAHPHKDELILFGGEFFNGQKTLVYNDLIFYNIIKRTWTVLKAPGGPPPRCGHQLVAVPTNKGQLWVFGGEFTSETESQFHHYRDLWVFHMAERKWEKVVNQGGPSSRSGHRMIALKKQLVVFGGYHDNLGDYKYFNDVHIFDLETYKWVKLEPTGTAPAPRSACMMAPTKDGKILIYGGYSKEKVKKDVDKGVVHSDMFLLCPEKSDATGLKWKWTNVKQGGAKLSPRSGSSIAVASADRAFTFGGVYDIVEDEEDLSGTFYNDLNILDLEGRVWRSTFLTGKKDPALEKRRRRKVGEEDTEEKDELEEELEVENVKEPPVQTVTDGVFTMTVGPALNVATDGTAVASGSAAPVAFTPSPRMSCGLAVKHGFLYLYGGVFEDGDKELTFADLYRLDLHKMDEWQTLLEDEEASKEWVAGDSDEEDDDDDEDDESGESEEDDEDDEAMETD